MANNNLSEKQLFVRMALQSWESYNDRVNKLVKDIGHDQLSREIAPGKNTGTYLFGHLIAINDNLFPLFGLGEKLFPQLGKIFLDSPDKSGNDFPSVDQLKNYWNEVNSKLSDYFSKMTPDEWFEKHAAVSDEDFIKEPHRNKLNVILNRTNHQSYHLGQLIYLRPSSRKE